MTPGKNEPSPTGLVYADGWICLGMLTRTSARELPTARRARALMAKAMRNRLMEHLLRSALEKPFRARRPGARPMPGRWGRCLAASPHRPLLHVRPPPCGGATEWLEPPDLRLFRRRLTRGRVGRVLDAEQLGRLGAEPGEFVSYDRAVLE